LPQTHPDRFELAETVSIALMYLVKSAQAEGDEAAAIGAATSTIIGETGKTSIFGECSAKLGEAIYILGYSLQMAGKEAEEVHEKVRNFVNQIFAMRTLIAVAARNLPRPPRCRRRRLFGSSRRSRRWPRARPQ
jgi:hypothetical protein